MIGSKVKILLLIFFYFKHSHLGCFSEVIDWNVGAVPSDFNLGVCMWTEILKTSKNLPI